ncbi:hypothetical protein ACL7BL_004572 [Vibrio vulnificus]
MKDFGKTAGNLSRNPLGIIALAFVFVYAIAGVYTSQATLDIKLMTILVSFLVLFPCLVLFVFYRLVTRHHNKLYAPQDFSDENNFIKSLETKVHNLEDLTEQISKQIDDQPLYRYTKLEEVGKRMTLYLFSSKSFKFSDFVRTQNGFSEREIHLQLQALCEYGWCSFVDDLVKITDRGDREISTFEDICYGRMS